MDAKSLTIRSIKNGLKEGLFSVKELQEEFYSLVKKENKKFNAFLTIFEPEKSELSNGSLSGVPIAIKDNILIEGTKTTAGSKILENYIAPYSATVIKKLQDSGAWFLGKTNLDEFAMGSSTENSAFGVTKNPIDEERVPGGSSGGSAAAVASGIAVCALGSDTGGSIRQPASFCGVVGLKPTYGRVSRYGLIAMASSFDQIGPITKNVYDAALMMNAISGHDPMDSTTSPKPSPDYTLGIEKDVSGLKVGVPREFFFEGLDSKIASVVKNAINQLEKSGAEIMEISLPNAQYSIPAYYILVPAEISANLARFDGIRYGFSEPAKELIDVYKISRVKGFGREVRRRIILGTYILSAGYFDAYYLKALKVRSLIKKDFDEAFKEVDVIVGPTSPTVAFKIGEKLNDPLSMYLSDIYTAVVNLAGLPAISIPCGKSDGLPVGFHIIGRPFDEQTIIRTAYSLERNLK